MCVGRSVCVVSVLCVCVRPLSSVELCDVLSLGYDGCGQVSRGLDVVLISMRQGETASAHLSSSYAGAAYPCELRVTLECVHRHHILAQGGVVRTRVAAVVEEEEEKEGEEGAARVTTTATATATAAAAAAAFIRERSVVQLRLAEQPAGASGEAVACDHRLSFTVRAPTFMWPSA